MAAFKRARSRRSWKLHGPRLVRGVTRGWMLNKCKHPVRHELRGSHRRTPAGHLRDRHQATAGGNLDPATGTGGGHFIGAHVAACVDHNLYPITLHIDKNA